GSDQAGAGKIGSYARAAQIGAVEFGASHLRGEQRCLCEGCVRQIRLDEPSLIEDDPIQARALQICPVELCKPKIAAGEIEAREIELRQPLSLQIRRALLRAVS